MLQYILRDLSYDQSGADREVVEDGVSFRSSDLLPSCFETTRLASCSVLAAAISLRRLIQPDENSTSSQIGVDRRLASLWFGQSIVPEGWKLPPVWDVLSAQLSLAKSAELLSRFPSDNSVARFTPCNEADLCDCTEETAWGRARRVRFPVSIEGCQADWSYAAGTLRSSIAKWEV